jgi:hypothetical protein
VALRLPDATCTESTGGETPFGSKNDFEEKAFLDLLGLAVFARRRKR